MKVQELFEINDKQAQIKRAKEEYKIESSEAELQARAKEFSDAYENPRYTWSKIKESMYFMMSDLRSTWMRPAVFNDCIKNEDQLQEFFFDKFFSYLKKAGFPRVESKDFYSATQDEFKKWMMQ